MAPPDRSVRRKRLSLAVLLVAVVAAVFGRAANSSFVLVDDDINIYRNSLIHPPSQDGLRTLWSEAYQGMYIPFTYTALAVVANLAQADEGDPGAVNGLDPRPFHIANIALHALVALLVFAILLALLGDALPAFAGALLFAVHPVQVEPVAWATGMKDLWSGVFAFAAILGYVLYARKRGWVAWCSATVCFVLACLSKPSAMVVPLIAGVIDVGLIRSSWTRAAKALWPWFAVALAVGLIASGQQTGETSPQTPLLQRPAVAGDAVAFYLTHLVWPHPQALFYGRTPSVALDGRAWLMTLVPVAVLAGAFLVRRRTVLPLVAFAILVAGLAPVLGLVPFTHQTYSTVADRYLYLSMLGPALLLGGVLRAYPRIVAYGAAAALLTAFGVRAAQRVPVWKDTETLLRQSLEVNPNSSFCHNNIGEVLAQRGEIEPAIEHFREAVRIEPNSARNRSNLGSYLGQTGQVEEAEVHLREAVRLKPDYGLARVNLASALMGQNKIPDAIAELRVALELEPGGARPHFLLGYMLELDGDLSGAVEAYGAAVEFDPDMIDAQVRQGGLYLQLQRLPDALRVLESAVASRPDHAEAQSELGQAFLAASRPLDAIPHLEESLRLAPGAAHVQEMLDWARRAVGQ